MADLGDRTKYLGASDFPCLTGSNKYKSYDMLVAEKKGLIVNVIKDPFYINRGNEYEEIVMDELEEQFPGNVQRQFEAVHSVLPNKAHLDGLIDLGEGAGYLLVEVKSKTIPKEYKGRIEEYAEELYKNPPQEYIDQIVNQYYLARYHSKLYIADVELIIGLFDGRNTKEVERVTVNVLERVKRRVTGAVDLMISQFWADVENPEYEFDKKTQLEIKRYEMGLKLEEKNAGLDVEADEEDSKLLREYRELICEKDGLEAELGKVSGRLENVEKILQKKHPNAKSIGDSFNRVHIKTELWSGRYNSAKEESISMPQFKTKMELV